MREPFSINNCKISGRQIHRTLTLELLGISTLLLPPLLASGSGTDGVFALLAGGAGALALLAFWHRQFQKQSFPEPSVSAASPLTRERFLDFSILNSFLFTGSAA